MLFFCVSVFTKDDCSAAAVTDPEAFYGPLYKTARTPLANASLGNICRPLAGPLAGYDNYDLYMVIPLVVKVVEAVKKLMLRALVDMGYVAFTGNLLHHTSFGNEL